MKKALLLPLLASISAPALALPKMAPHGFNGLVNLGVMGGEFESNFTANIDVLNIDLSSERIDDFGSPDAEGFVSGMGNFDIGWTFSNNKTRLSIGNDFTDILEFDRATRVSLRHDFDNIGQFRLDGLTSSQFTTQVYRDPYLLGVDRPDTDLETTGARLVWHDMFSTKFGIEVLGKEREIDNEESGNSIASLTPAERDLLDREGDILSVRLIYNFRVDDWHRIQPQLEYINRDLDGDAMAQEGFILGFQHFYIGDKIEWATQLNYTYMEAEETNPIFNEDHDATGFAVSSIVSFPGLFGFAPSWRPNVQVSYVDLDSDIDFNDQRLWTIAAGMAYKF